MVQRLRTLSKEFLEIDSILERFTFSPEDSFLVTYPRSTDGWGHLVLPDWTAFEQPKK